MQYKPIPQICRSQQKCGTIKPQARLALKRSAGRYSCAIIGKSSPILAELQLRDYCAPAISIAGLLAQPRSLSKRINLMLLPPLPLVASGVVLLMVNGAKRHLEFIADLEPKALGLWNRM
jgi:hypothetical protein